MIIARVNAHWTARTLDRQEPERLAAALAQLGIAEPIQDAVHHAFVRPHWRFRPAYHATTVILECAAAYRRHADDDPIDLDALSEESRLACRDISRANWIRGTIPSGRLHRTRSVRAHRVVNRIQWAD